MHSPTKIRDRTLQKETVARPRRSVGISGEADHSGLKAPGLARQKVVIAPLTESVSGIARGRLTLNLADTSAAID